MSVNFEDSHVQESIVFYIHIQEVLPLFVLVFCFLNWQHINSFEKKCGSNKK